MENMIQPIRGFDGSSYYQSGNSQSGVCVCNYCCSISGLNKNWWTRKKTFWFFCHDYYVMILTGVDVIEEHLREIRSLRQRLEDSIRTNERLRQQLEGRLATAARDTGVCVCVCVRCSHSCCWSECDDHCCDWTADNHMTDISNNDDCQCHIAFIQQYNEDNVHNHPVNLSSVLMVEITELFNAK